jgi:hypothetical protein
MLRAILEGKAGRVELEVGTSQSWREVFQKREDLLTAVFFGRLRYLSIEGEQSVLTLLIGKDLSLAAGPIHKIDFWSKLPLKNRRHVEPDIIIECENATILVEVKPPFGGEQYAGQWKAEINSLIQDRYAEEAHPEHMKNIHFVALGRNFIGWKAIARKLEADFGNYSLKVHAMEWDQIRDEIAIILKQEDGRDRAVYEDWMEAFALFGMRRKLLPFTEMNEMSTVLSEWRPLFADWRPL